MITGPFYKCEVVMTRQIIPIIDITPFREGTAKHKLRVAHEVLAICESIGFLRIAGHGIASDVFDRACRTAFAFYDLPLHEKQAAAAKTSGQQRGYAPFASKGLAATSGSGCPARSAGVILPGAAR